MTGYLVILRKLFRFLGIRLVSGYVNREFHLLEVHTRVILLEVQTSFRGTYRSIFQINQHVSVFAIWGRGAGVSIDETRLPRVESC